MLKRFAGPAWATLEYAWYPALLLVTTPWFLGRLGVDQYGHWMLLTATAGLGAALNAGTGVATIKGISTTIARSAHAGTEHVLRASLAIGLIAGVGLASLVLAVFWLGGDKLLPRMGDVTLVRLTGAAAAVLIFLEQLDSIFSSGLKGAEQFGHAAKIEIASRSTQVIATALVLLPWPTLRALYATLITVAVIRLLTKMAIVKRVLAVSDLRPSFHGSLELLALAKWGWLQGVGATLFGIADRLLVGSLLGASSLAYYSIASQLAMQVHAVTSAGLSVMFPKMSRKLAVDHAFSVWRATSLAALGNLLSSSVLALALIASGSTILHIWIGPASAAPTSQILPWLVVAYWLLALNTVPYFTLLGMGRVRFVGLVALAAGCAATVATYLSIGWFGLIGAAVGRGLYAALSLTLFIPVIQHLMRERATATRVSSHKSVPFPP